MKTNGGTVAMAASMNQPAGVVTGARSPNAPAVIVVITVTVVLTTDILIGLSLWDGARVPLFYCEHS
jgi:hypothetical protein